MTDAPKFLVFVRSDRFTWGAHRAEQTLAEAIHVADTVVAQGIEDRAVVMEIGGVDAMPMFTWKYRAKRA
jgi:D-tyrosyl-tRNA(Tyr) deacylase